LRKTLASMHLGISAAYLVGIGRLIRGVMRRFVVKVWITDT
jgi:hypothetical protein